MVVEVTLNSKNTPSSFTWRGVIHRVKEVQECWRLMGAWWDGEGERTFFRVRTDDSPQIKPFTERRRIAGQRSFVRSGGV